MNVHTRNSLSPQRRVILLALLVVAAPADHWTDSATADEGRAVGTIGSRGLDEVSGVAASRQNVDVLWMHNDGDAQSVFAVRPAGQVVARVHLLVKTSDLEDIALGPGPAAGVDYLYLGDMGDNDGKRREVRILRFVEPLLHREGRNTTVRDVDEFRLTYPARRYDAESLLVDPLSGDVFVVTKEKNRARVFVARAGQLRTSANAALEQVAVLKVEYVSGGDFSRDGSRIALRRETRGWVWERRDGEDVAAALARAPREIPVRVAGQSPNGEAIAFHPDGQGVYTVSEGEHEAIGFVAVPPAADDRPR